MNIGLDWDGTVTRDEIAFLAMVHQFRKRGHKVYITTMRYHSELEELAGVAKLVDGIIASGRRSKRAACAEHGIVIDVWIDDNPYAVEKDASEIWDTVTPEGVVDPYPKTGTFA